MKPFLSHFSIICLIFYIFLSCLFLNAEDSKIEVQDACGSAYFPILLNAINNAKQSIDAAIYIILLDPKGEETKVKRVLDALVSAKQRGAKIRIVMEFRSLIDLTKQGLRYHAYNYLKDNGIKAYFDESGTNCMHAKGIVIDEEIVIIGSSNWSETAFTSSYEINAVIQNRDLAKKILTYIEGIPVRKETSIDSGGSKDVFFIPCSFYDGDSGILRKLVANSDERALDIILMLWDLNQNTVSCGLIADKLDLSKKMDETACRRQIRKVLKKLENKYSLIKHTWRHGIDTIEISFPEYPNEGRLGFPKQYFEYGWHNRLSLPAKAVLITMYAEQSEVTGNVIRRPLLYLSKKYGIEVHTYSGGIQQLRKYNIIKVEYGKGFSERPDTKIAVLGVYDIDNYNKNIDELKKQYGQETLDKALNYADIIYSAFDIEIVGDIINKIRVYDNRSLEYAFSYIRRMRPDNYKRTYRYVTGILKRKGRQKNPPEFPNQKRGGTF